MIIKSNLDLRVVRTRKWLQQALIGLLREKAFRDIQITEIADRAEVSRPTFYLHFRSKEELLFSLIDQRFDEFFGELAAATASGGYSKLNLCTQLFSYWEQHEDVLQLFTQPDLQAQVTGRLQHYLRQVFSHLKMVTGQPLVDGPALEMMVAFMAGGTYALLLQWVQQEKPYSAEQMGWFLDQLTASHEGLLSPTQMTNHNN